MWGFELEESDGYLYSQADAGQMLVFGTQGYSSVEGTEMVLSWRWQVFLGEGPLWGLWVVAGAPSPCRGAG